MATIIVLVSICYNYLLNVENIADVAELDESTFKVVDNSNYTARMSNQNIPIKKYVNPIAIFQLHNWMNSSYIRAPNH